jgi:hypothetical protein
MPAVKSVSMLGPTFTAMGDAAQKANVATIREASNTLALIVSAHGGRYRLRGRNGQRWPLTAKADTRGFSTTAGATVVRGSVRGIPEGFWHIVTYGSGPHLIVRSNGRKKSRSSLLRAFESGELGSGVKPLRTPYGPRQFVHHPGHGAIGKPWETAMTQGAPKVAEIVAAGQFKAQLKAFT